MVKRDYFIPKMFGRLLVPSVISSLGFALADMADALVVGQKLGETGLAAISLCLPLFMLINLFMDALGIGGSIRFSQTLGEGNTKEAVACFHNIWVTTLAIGLCIGVVANLFAPQCLALLGTVPGDGELYTACKTYMQIIALGAPALMLNIVFSNFLRNDNNATLATKGFLVGNAVDIVLNIVFVTFLDMGTSGAALSTVTGSLVAIALYLPGIVGKKAEVLKIKYHKCNVKETLDCFKTGFSTSVQNLFQLIFFLVINRILMGLAGQGGIAVFDVVYNISFFIIYLYNGITEAAQPLTSTFSGENSEEDCACVLRLSKRYGLVLGAIMTACIVIFTRNLAAFFGIPEELMPLTVHAVRIYCIGFAFVGLNLINEKHYQAMDNTKLAFFVTLMRNLVVIVPSILLFAQFGIWTIWYMFPATELVTLLLFYLYRHFVLQKEEHFDRARILRIVVENGHEDMEELLTSSMHFCEKWNADDKQKYYVTLVIEEICMSIIRNAMTNIRDGKIRITLLAMEDGDFVLNVLDNAVIFNPFSFQSSKVELDKEFDIDQVSMMMIKKKTKKFMYRTNSGFNSLVVRI